MSWEQKKDGRARMVCSFSSSKLHEFRISAAAGIEFSVERAAGSSRAHVPGVHASDLKN